MSQPLPKSAVLIVNAKSRRGRTLFRESCRLLTQAGIVLSAAHAVRRPNQMGELAKSAIASGAPMVIVGGGDGSLSGVVDDFVGHDTVFALLPLGTANSFARSLGIPLDLPGAVAVIAEGRRRRIDLGMIDNDYFVNCASIGMSPLIAETVPDGLKRVLGRAGYLSWAAWKFTQFRPFRLTIEDGGRCETLDAVEVRIANGGYHGGTELVDEAEVDSGEIVVQVVPGNARHRLIWSWTASLMKLHLRKRTTREFRGKALRITTDPPLPISIDGEVLAHSPVIARIAAGIIEVAAPSASEVRSGN